MNFRVTQQSTFGSVQSGIQLNLFKLAQAQAQLSSGKRVLRPSDDAVATSHILSLRSQMANVSNYMSSISATQQTLSTAASGLEDATTTLTEGRSLIIQAMNGALNDGDRKILAEQFDLLRDSMLDIANARDGSRYVFGGTATQTEPFTTSTVGGMSVVTYQGNTGEHSVPVGGDLEVSTNIPGSSIFARQQSTGVRFAGLTGASAGTSASSGSGYATLSIRHDATVGTLGAGLALASGGADDTIIGDHSLVVDTSAGTIQLGSGAPQALPDAGDPDYANFVVRDADGSEVHLDFSGWSGADVAGTVTGQGSVSLDGASYTPLSLSETNLQLVDDASGRVLHVDTTAISRAADELITFGGSANIFDTLAGVAADLRNTDGLSQADVVARLNERLVEFDRNQENVILGLGRLGSRLERLTSAEGRLGQLEVQLTAQISENEDVDLAEVVFELTAAEQALQVAQASGARLLQQSLLNFLG